MSFQVFRQRIACTPREPLHLFPITAHHRFFFLAAPTFDAHFHFEGRDTSLKLLDEYKRHWQSSRSVSTKFAVGMVTQAKLEIIGMSRVIGTITAFEDINPEGHGRELLALRYA